jgi:hypothetical protein
MRKYLMGKKIEKKFYLILNFSHWKKHDINTLSLIIKEGEI